MEREQTDNPLNVKVVVNFAPQDSGSATLQPLDTNALISILRNIAREPRIGKFSIVAFNMQEQRVIYRQEGLPDRLPGPREGAEGAQPGHGGFEAVEPEAWRHGIPGQPDHEGAEGREQEQPDAVIFAGPKVMLEDGLSAGNPEADFRRQNCRCSI